EHPELVWEGAPGALPGARPRHGRKRERHRGVEQPTGLQAMHGGEIRVRLHRVEVLAADHPEGRLGELSCDGRRWIRRGEAKRLREQRIAREQRLALAVRGPDARLATPLGV